MKSGTCRIIVNGADVGSVEYKYNESGRGEIWLEPEILLDAFSAKSVALRIGEDDLQIIITSATPGEAAPFAFKEWRKGM